MKIRCMFVMRFVAVLLSFCILAANGTRVWPASETEAIKQHGSDVLFPAGAFIEDSSGVSPCVSDPCKNGGTCSVTAGDSYSCQCTRGFKGETCKQDIDECAVKNGGCSHDCINMNGSYMCACPDPELSLADDRHSCEAKGVIVSCLQNEMFITIPKLILKGMDREHLRLLDPDCGATETLEHFSLRTPLTSCKTKRRHTKSAVVYSNKVLEIPLKQSDIITRVREVEIPFSCYYSNSRVATAVGLKPKSRKLVFSKKGQGNFTVVLELFHSKSYANAYNQAEFPVELKLRQQMYLQAKVESDDKRLTAMAEKCFATPTPNDNDAKKLLILKNGCPVDDTTVIYSSPSGYYRFGLEAFEFVNQTFAFIHCHVVICNASDPQARCTQGCQKNSRPRRNIGDHTVYSLAQGPITLDYTDVSENNDAHSAQIANPAVNIPLVAVMAVLTALTMFGVAVLALRRRSRVANYHLLAN